MFVLCRDYIALDADPRFCVGSDFSQNLSLPLYLLELSQTPLQPLSSSTHQ